LCIDFDKPQRLDGTGKWNVKSPIPSGNVSGSDFDGGGGISSELPFSPPNALLSRAPGSTGASLNAPVGSPFRVSGEVQEPIRAVDLQFGVKRTAFTGARFFDGAHVLASIFVGSEKYELVSLEGALVDGKMYTGLAIRFQLVDAPAPLIYLKLPPIVGDRWTKVQLHVELSKSAAKDAVYFDGMPVGKLQFENVMTQGVLFSVGAEGTGNTPSHQFGIDDVVLSVTR
jgi:hypothetical protein